MSFVRRLLGRKTDNTEKAASLPPQDEVQPDAKLQGSDTQLESTADLDEPTPAIGAVESLWEDDPGEVTAAVGSPHTRARHQDKGLRVGYASDIGKSRDHNEDTVIAFQGVHLGDDSSGPLGFFVVADGMGGHHAGEVASSLAARLVTREVLINIYLSFVLDETPVPDMAPITEILRNAVQNANDQVHEQVPGGGTTLTCALILGRRAYIAHVGDSRAYLLNNSAIKQVTQDHSYVGRLIELGELSPEEAAVHPQRHVLYRAIGQGDNLAIDTYHHSLPSGSRLLLCSDGLSGLVSEQEIRDIIASASTPQEACQRLLEAANDAGGPDNITAVLIETPPD